MQHRKSLIIFITLFTLFATGASCGGGVESSNNQSIADSVQTQNEALDNSASQQRRQKEGEGTQTVNEAVAIVTYVIDGDTVVLENDERVRLIGIDAPESGKSYFSDSRNKLIELVQGKEVRLEKDVSEKDRYDRLLRYIFAGDTFVNLEMVKSGYANSYTYPPDVKYQEQLRQAEREAREKQIGLWEQAEDASSTPASTQTGSTEGSDAENESTQDTSTSGPTGQTSGTSNVEVSNFHPNAPGNDNYNLNEEYFVLKNTGSATTDLAGWTAADKANHVFTFPNFTLEPGAIVTVYTGSGANTSTALYWGSSGAVWNNSGDTLHLRDSTGNLILEYRY